MTFKSAEGYIASLPEFETARLPRGALFVASGRIYQVIETGGVFAKAREWRHDERTDVALIPGSFLTRYLPLVQKGRLLPVYRSRTELAQNGQAGCFLFPTEPLALDAAYFDVALIMCAGAYVRNHNHEPAFAVTDGVHIFRLYYYERSVHGHPTAITSKAIEHPRCDLRPYTEGPGYWRVLPSWHEIVPSSQKTQQMPAIRINPDPPLASPSASTVAPAAVAPPAASTPPVVPTAPAPPALPIVPAPLIPPIVPSKPFQFPDDDDDNDLDKTLPHIPIRR